MRANAKGRAGDAAPVGISVQQEPCLNSPNADLKQELPRVAAARARDNAARARLRGLIPDKMKKLEHGRTWQKAEALRAEVFPPKDGGGEP